MRHCHQCYWRCKWAQGWTPPAITAAVKYLRTELDCLERSLRHCIPFLQYGATSNEAAAPMAIRTELSRSMTAPTRVPRDSRPPQLPPARSISAGPTTHLAKRVLPFSATLVPVVPPARLLGSTPTSPRSTIPGLQQEQPTTTGLTRATSTEPPRGQAKPVQPHRQVAVLAEHFPAP